MTVGTCMAWSARHSKKKVNTGALIRNELICPVTVSVPLIPTNKEEIPYYSTKVVFQTIWDRFFLRRWTKYEWTGHCKSVDSFYQCKVLDIVCHFVSKISWVKFVCEIPIWQVQLHCTLQKVQKILTIFRMSENSHLWEHFLKLYFKVSGHNQ